MEHFLEELFGDDLTPERRVAVFTTPDLHTRFFSDAAELARYAGQQSKTQDVYFGVGLIRGTPAGRGKLEDVAGIGALWCDIDVSGEGHQKENLPQNTEEAQWILSEMPLAPSIVVHSGHGLHAYWLLQEPWVFTSNSDRHQAASLAKRWHGKVCQVASGRGWALENLGDLTRVLRLPGTLNHKGSGDPAEVRILQCDPTRRYAADDFTPYLPPDPVAAEADHTPPGPILLHAGAEPPAGKLVDAVSQSPLFLQSWNRQRTDLPDQSQSGYDLSLATLAALRGWDDQEIANLIIAVRRCHQQNPAKSLREDYVRRTISKAREAAIHGGGEGSEVDLTAMLGLSDIDDDLGPPDPKSPGPFPVELIDQCPDLVKRAMDYYMSCAVEARPLLFLASLIAATGTVLGHKVRDISGLRTNLYTLGILTSGGGKEASREMVFKIFQHAGIAAMCGQEDFASDSGVITALEVQNPILFQLDEFGRFMRAIDASGARSAHLYHIASTLLKLYSKSGSVYRAKAYADRKRNREVVQPHACLYGTSVRSVFWRAMSVESIEGGFLPRILIFETKEEAESGGAVQSDPPGDVTEFFAFWANRRITPGNLEPVHPQPAIIPYTSTAKGMMDDFRNHQKDQQKLYGALGTLWSRARENAGKVALIHACWKDRDAPVVDEVSARWAIDVVRHCVEHATYEASFCISEGAFHEKCQIIMRAIEEAEGRRISRRELTRATRNMTPRERGEAIDTLIEQGRLGMKTVQTGGRPKTWYVAT